MEGPPSDYEPRIEFEPVESGKNVIGIRCSHGSGIQMEGPRRRRRIKCKPIYGDGCCKKKAKIYKLSYFQL